MTLLATIGRQQIADYVSALFTVYMIVILIRVLLSWVPRMPYNRFLRMAVSFVEEVADPYLNLFRRFLPPIGGGGMAIDLSPIIGIVVLYVVGGLVTGAIRG